MTDDRWLTFDCFGTLIDWNNGFRAILAPLVGERTDALMRAYHGVERRMEAEKPHRLYRDVLTAGLAEAAKSLGVSLAAAEADILVRRWGDQPLFQDAPGGLAAVRAAGWKIAILTNCDDDLFGRTASRNPQLAPDLVITAEQVGSYKPALGHFIRFEQQTGVARGNWVHVANSWFHDIEPARRYGVTRIWMDRDRTGDDPTAASHVIARVADLPGALRTLGGR
jgi:2-haloacid dehalogenase